MRCRASMVLQIMAHWIPAYAGMTNVCGFARLGCGNGCATLSVCPRAWLRFSET
jgi:hypothetical protein